MDKKKVLTDTEQEQEKPRSFIAIEFTAPGSAMFRIIPENVSPLQLLLVGEYLKLTAKSQIMIQEQESRAQQEQMKIQVPTGKIVTDRRH